MSSVKLIFVVNYRLGGLYYPRFDGLVFCNADTYFIKGKNYIEINKR